MFTSVKGIFRNGKVELLEPAPQANESPVVVTFLPDRNSVDLQSRSIDEHQATELRARLKTVAEDWERPEMDVYDEL
jgi:hypothetical protein